MEYFKFIGCFIILTCVCMLPVILGGAELWTSDFGVGLAISMIVSLFLTPEILVKEEDDNE